MLAADFSWTPLFATKNLVLIVYNYELKPLKIFVLRKNSSLNIRTSFLFIMTEHKKFRGNHY
jgi:hypothetical protein